MSFSQAVIAFRVKQTNLSLANLAVLLQETPAPEDYFESIGGQIIADTTAIASPNVTRTMTVGLAAGTPATLVPTVEGGQIIGFTVSVAGSGYKGPPIIQVANPTAEPAGRPGKFQAYLKVQGSVIVNGGTYTAPTLLFQGGLKLPEIDNEGLVSEPSCVQSLSLVTKGLGYSANAKIQFECALQPSGHLPIATLTRDAQGRVTSVLVTDTGAGLLSVPVVTVWDPGPTSNGSGGGNGCELVVCQMGVGTAATATATVMAGNINTVTITNHGGPYASIPKVLVVDATPGSGGGVISALMGIHSVDVLDGGLNYPGGTHLTTTITDLFTSLFGASAAGATPAFVNVGVRWPIEVTMLGPVTALPPVLT